MTPIIIKGSATYSTPRKEELNSETFSRMFQELGAIVPFVTLARIKGYFWAYLGAWKAAKEHESAKGITDGMTQKRVYEVGETLRLQASEALFDWLFEAFAMTDEAKAAGITTKNA